MDIKYNRNSDVLSGSEDLEIIYTIKNFPVYMGATEESFENDQFTDLNYQISKSTGMVQINPLVNLNIVYKSSHGPGLIGNIWKNHHQALSDFLLQFNKNFILEIGGYSGVLANFSFEKRKDLDWTIVDPHVQQFDSRIKVINSFFNEEYENVIEYDMIVHSHLLEHIIDINSFLSLCNRNLNLDGLMIFSLPNFDLFLNKRITNCLHFEHTVFLNEYFLFEFFKKNNFEVIQKKYYDECCSIFYCLKKSSKHFDTSNNTKYNEYKDKLLRYFYDINFFIKQTNLQIENEENVFMFGGHVTSQFLISMGLNEKKIKFLLDNDKKKQNKRLYGTELIIKSPEILSKYNNPILILKNSSFDEEIKDQVFKINSSVNILTF
jgi:hypothetical protein